MRVYLLDQNLFTIKRTGYARYPESENEKQRIREINNSSRMQFKAQPFDFPYS